MERVQASAQAGTLLATQPYLLRQQSAALPHDQAALNARAPVRPMKASEDPAAEQQRGLSDQVRQQRQLEPLQRSLPGGSTGAADPGAAQQENVPPADSTAGDSKLQKTVGGKGEALASALQRLKVAAPSQQPGSNSPHITSRSGHSITPPVVAPATAASAVVSAVEATADPTDAICAGREAHLSAASLPADSDLDHLVSSDGTVDLEEAAFHSQGNADEQPGKVFDTAEAQLTGEALQASDHQPPAQSRGSGHCSALSASEDDVQCAQRPPGER